MTTKPEITDADRLDWLERRHVKVGKLRMYGESIPLFAVEPDLEEERSDLRRHIDAFITAERHRRKWTGPGQLEREGYIDAGSSGGSST